MGDNPWIVEHTDHFTFIKEGDGDGSSYDSPADWPCLGELFEGEESVHELLPKVYAFDYPYPNPFNPAVTLRYSIPDEGRVYLVMYNIQGREVQKLVDEWQSAGYYDLKVEGSDLSSGIYFVRLKACGFTKTHKLLLIK